MTTAPQTTTSRPSPWLEATAGEAAAPPLAGERRVDVAVIGAGYTGLGAALALRAEGLSVAIAERETAGFGASGRNAGHLTPTIGKDLPTLLALFGRERASAFVRLAEAAIAHVERWIAEHAIACAYEPVGNVMAAVHASQERRLERAARVAAELGARAEWLDGAAMRKRGLPEAFTAGVLESAGGILQPALYARGLRRAALAAGAELYENTPVLRIDEGPRVALATPGGRLVADRVVVATNAYTPELGLLRRAVLPLRVTLFRTEPLTRAQRERIDWRGREGIYTAHEMLESYRLDADGRIVGGSKSVRVRFGGGVPEEHDDVATRALLERTLRERFPGLDVPIERFWGGPIAFALDFLPAMGVTGRFRNLYYALSYAGHGLALASYAGTALADWIAGREGPGRILHERWRPPLPPEPLRWLVVKALTGGLRAVDARVDRRVRAAQRG
ncbi:MAG: FAD-dependent oxidoreductase [Proteobacteria bacterium]|nr:MAG: FAD-dependent oxidoreductase [Pseudomonadota bacterium]